MRQAPPKSDSIAENSSADFDRLFMLISSKTAAGEPIDLEALTADCPQHREQLEMLLPTLQAIADLGHSVAAQSSGSPNSAIRNPNSAISGTLGDFRILRELGRGGMGVIYEAEQISLRRKMALKVLPFAATLDRTRLKRFQNEARAAATLDHPNIVAVHSVGEERGVHYYAMQLVEGQSLAEAIEQLRNADCGLRNGRKGTGGRGQEAARESGKGGKGERETPSDHSPPTTHHSPSDQSAIRNPQFAIDTSPLAALSTEFSTNPKRYFRTIAQLGAQIADALDHAHQSGVIHRDIKPANIMLDREGQALVTDFGLARIEADQSITVSGDLLGTLRYASPEQVLGQSVVDHRTDIYSLGATLYEALALTPALTGNERGELLQSIAEQTPKPLSGLDRRISKDLETIVGKALEKDPEDRYASAAAMAADLRAFAEQRPITARPPSFATRAQKWVRRHTAAVAAALLVLMLASVGLAVAAAMVGRQRTIALGHAASAQENAVKADDNYQLALAALEETLAESVVGELIVEPIDEKRSELQRRGIDFYERLAAKNGVEPTMWPAYQLLVFNERLGEAFALEKQDPAAAETAFQDAIGLAEKLVAATGGEAKNQAKLIHAVDDYTNLLGNTGRNEEAIGQSLRAARLIAQLRTNHPDFPLIAYLTGKNLYNRSVFHEKAGRLDDAERLCREALPHLEDASASDPDSTELFDIRTLASCRYNLAFYLAQRGENEEAAQLWQKALTDWRALILMRPTSSEFNSRAGATLSNLALLARQQADYATCRRLAAEAIVHQKRALHLKPSYEHAKDFLAKHYHELSLALSALRDREALAASAEDRVSHLPDVHSEYCAAAMSLGDCMEQLYADTEYAGPVRKQLMNQYVRRALELLGEASKRFEDGRSLYTTANAYLMLGDGLAEMERPDDARTAWQSADALFKRVRDSVQPQHQHQFDESIASTQRRLASVVDHQDASASKTASPMSIDEKSIE